MHCIDEILLRKGRRFNEIAPDSTVLDAAALMKNENMSYLIVSREEDYCGIISERDCLQKVMLANKHPETTLVKEVMTTNLPTLSCTDSTEDCMRKMETYHTRYMPVFDGLTFKGVITMQDLVRETIAEMPLD